MNSTHLFAYWIRLRIAIARALEGWHDWQLLTHGVTSDSPSDVDDCTNCPVRDMCIAEALSADGTALRDFIEAEARRMAIHCDDMDDPREFAAFIAMWTLSMVDL